MKINIDLLEEAVKVWTANSDHFETPYNVSTSDFDDLCNVLVDTTVLFAMMNLRFNGSPVTFLGRNYKSYYKLRSAIYNNARYLAKKEAKRLIASAEIHRVQYDILKMGKS